MNSRTALHVAPELAPSQMSLPEAQRDIPWARKNGAEWSSLDGTMIVGPHADEKEKSSLMARFSGRAAKERALAARNEMGARPDWYLMAFAANEEMLRRGEKPIREIASSNIEREDRLYLFSIADTSSPFSTSRLDKLASDAGVIIFKDIEIPLKDMGRGLRYIDARKDIPEELIVFSGNEARKARKDYQASRSVLFSEIADAATIIAGDKSVLSHRLTSGVCEKNSSPRSVRRDADSMVK